MDLSSGESFHCPVPGCESKFKRKEHLVQPTIIPTVERDGSDIPSLPTRSTDNSYNVLQSLFSPDTLQWHPLDSSKQGPEPAVFAPSSSAAATNEPSALTETPSTTNQWCPTPSLPPTQAMIKQPSHERPPAEQAPAQAPAPRNPESHQHQRDPREPSSNASTEPPIQPSTRLHPSKIESLVPKAYTTAYFKNFHPQWPILHPASYHILDWGPELIWSITMLGARFTYTEEGKLTLLPPATPPSTTPMKAKEKN
ncbi:MAG: hypothetical protein Q9160_006643 [Pyrenula sp. 1 TL-2023]